MTTPSPDLLDVPAALSGRAGVLWAALALWATRKPGEANPGVRQAANTAMDEIDAMLGELHRVRQRLVGEIREYDDAFMAALDARYGPLPGGAQPAAGSGSGVNLKLTPDNHRLTAAAPVGGE